MAGRDRGADAGRVAERHGWQAALLARLVSAVGAVAGRLRHRAGGAGDVPQRCRAGRCRGPAVDRRLPGSGVPHRRAPHGAVLRRKRGAGLCPLAARLAARRDLGAAAGGPAGRAGGAAAACGCRPCRAGRALRADAVEVVAARGGTGVAQGAVLGAGLDAGGVLPAGPGAALSAAWPRAGSCRADRVLRLDADRHGHPRHPWPFRPPAGNVAHGLAGLCRNAIDRGAARGRRAAVRAGRGAGADRDRLPRRPGAVVPRQYHDLSPSPAGWPARRSSAEGRPAAHHPPDPSPPAARSGWRGA